MTLRFLPRIATALTLTLVPMAAMADGPWEGTWQTNYSDLNLTQEGQLVYGEYVGRGYIVGSLDASGTVLRGAWVHSNSDRWGALEFRMQNGWYAFEGQWVEQATTFTYGTGTAWTGTALNPVPVYTAQWDGYAQWPVQFDFNNPTVLAWLQHTQSVVPVAPVNPVAPVSPDPTPQPLTTGGVQCPDVAMDPGLSASNNPYVTGNGIADATSAPWTIYGQPPAAPLGSLSFGGDRLHLQLDACIPVFGLANAATRNVISITGASLLQTGGGDYRGTGWFHDPSIGVSGEIVLYLTNPGEGQGLAALTLGNGAEWSESVLLDYSAD